MSGKKIIFIDIDGTLFDYNQQIIPASAVHAVRMARQNGHRVYLSTGRSLAEIYPYIWEVGFDGVIGGSGSFVQDGTAMLVHKIIPLTSVTHAVNWMVSKGIEFYEESNSGLYASRNFLTAAAKILGIGDEDDIQKIREAFPHMIYGADMYRDDINKFSFIIHPKVTVPEIEQEFSGEFNIIPWGINEDKDSLFELSQKGLNKRNAIEILLRHLKAEQSDTIGIGDSPNDIEMLQYCNIGIAMGNAKSELKEIADYVTSEVDQDGIWNAFINLSLLA